MDTPGVILRGQTGVRPLFTDGPDQHRLEIDDRRAVDRFESSDRQRVTLGFDAGVRRLQCLPWEAETGLRWAELLARLRRTGRAMPIKDSFIAATALAHDLSVVTRHRDHFEPAGVRVVNPFSPSV
jgi:hypothetical protein